MQIDRLNLKDWMQSSTYTQPEVLRVLGLTIVLFASFLVLERLLPYAYSAPESAYAAGTPLLFAIRTHWWAWLVIVGLTVLLLTPKANLTWQQLPHGRALRILIVVVGGVLVWSLATLEYNYYFDNAYLVERGLLVALLLGLLWHPAFIIPLIAALPIQLNQLTYPDFGAGFMFPHKVHLLHVLNLFAAFVLLNRVYRSGRVEPFVILVLCLVAAVYWVPGYTKLAMGWLTYGDLQHMPLAAYAHGWTGTFTADEVVRFAQSIQPYEWMLRAFTLGFELAFIFALLHRQLTVVLLVSASLFHVGVFLFYGYLFWTWISLNLVLAVTLLMTNGTRKPALKLFTPPNTLLAIVIIGSAALWLAPSRLAWFDSTVTYTYEHIAITEDDAQYTLPKRFFGPYGDVFTMAYFAYLVPHGQVVGPYAVVSDRMSAELVNATKNLSELEALEQSIGQNSYDARRSGRHTQFLQSYLGAWNHNPTLSGSSWYTAPCQFCTAQPHRQVPSNKIREVIVVEVTTLYDGANLQPVRSIEVLRVPIPK